MKPRPRTLLSLACLVLCLTFVILWPRSYWRSDALRLWFSGSHNTSYHGFFLYSGHGGVLLSYDHSSYFVPVSWLSQIPLYSTEQDPKAPDDGNRPHTVSSVSVAHFGYYYDRDQPPPPSRSHPRGSFSSPLISETGLALFVPHWFPILLTSLPPLLYLRTARRSCPGLCRSCGYDLRATPDRCPECGTPATLTAPSLPPRSVSL